VSKLSHSMRKSPQRLPNLSRLDVNTTGTSLAVFLRRLLHVLTALSKSCVTGNVQPGKFRSPFMLGEHAHDKDAKQ